jgi:hypothetical protein
VKDTWGDDRRRLEGEFYAEIGACEGVAEIYSYAIVQAEGKADLTSHLIRRGLLPEGPRAIDADQKTNKDCPLISFGNDTHVITQYVFNHLPEIPDEQARLRSGTYSRLVMKTYGWPIKYAKSLPELVGAMKDAIIGTIFCSDNIFRLLTSLLGHQSCFPLNYLPDCWPQFITSMEFMS